MESATVAPQDSGYSADIEILKVDLLDSERETVEEIVALASRLEIGLGWHYLLDFGWLCRKLGEGYGAKVLDAGAGTGVLQWYLADRGANVLSVDRGVRFAPTHRIRRRFRVEGYETGYGVAPTGISSAGATSWRKTAGYPRRLAVNLAQVSLEKISRKAPGRVTFLNAYLADLSSVPEGSIDAVVSVSALEHNDLEAIPDIVTELHRVLKPGGRLLATMAASQDRDWYHEPSKGWVLTSDSIRRIFGAPSARALGFDDYHESLRQLTACEELRTGLAAFYFESGENGMPWGKWQPAYLPVGVALTKSRPEMDGLWC
jgi:ubiquinone/menaquinone biosynthesis C-methylase UbiE